MFAWDGAAGFIGTIYEKNPTDELNIEATNFLRFFVGMLYFSISVLLAATTQAALFLYIHFHIFSHFLGSVGVQNYSVLRQSNIIVLAVLASISHLDFERIFYLSFLLGPCSTYKREKTKPFKR